MRRYPYFCVRDDKGRYLAMAPRGSLTYTEFVEDVRRSLKFKTEDDLGEWCAVNDVWDGNIFHRR